MRKYGMYHYIVKCSALSKIKMSAQIVTLQKVTYIANQNIKWNSCIKYKINHFGVEKKPI